MRSTIILLVLSAAVLGGCTSAYKTGQTPDDVYYSPTRQHDEYLTVKENEDRQYQYSDEYYDDRYLRMKVHNRLLWSDLDDYNFYNPRYSYSYYNNMNWNNPWSPYTYWNYYYNPYCSPGIISKTNTAYNHPRVFNLNTYNIRQLTSNNYTNPKSGTYNNYNYSNNNRPVRMVGLNNSNNNNSNSNAGNFLRNIFNGSSNNNSSNNNSSNNSSRTSSSSSSSSGSSGSSGSTAPVRKF